MLAAMCSVFFRNVMRGEVGVLHQRARRSQRIVAAGANRDHALVRVDDLARAADDQQRILVRHDHLRFELTHSGIAAPHLRQRNRRAFEVRRRTASAFPQTYRTG